MSKERIEVVIMGAGARGNRVFAELISQNATGFAIAGVVEPHPDRREVFRTRYRLPEDRSFASVEEFLDAPRFADIVFICTPDPTHYTLCRAVSEKGYDILLEKPVATNLPDCLSLLDVEQTHGNRIFVAHVLRYSPFFRAIRDIVRSGRLGEVRHVDLIENIGHWHFAHSYVRGNWRRSDESAPIILTKCSHDLDMIHWLVQKRVESVSSWGSLAYFTEENAPAGASERCVRCPHMDSCRYSAPRFYLNGKDEWPFTAIACPDSPEARSRAIAEGPYGRCVWRSDNDVCDNQTVVLQFTDGLHANFHLNALTAENTRTVTVRFDDAELGGNLLRGRLAISHFTGRSDAFQVEEVQLPPTTDDSHGGGDLHLLRALYEHLTEGTHSEIMTSLRNSIMSHVLAFLAEESRTSDSAKLPIPEIFSQGTVRAG